MKPSCQKSTSFSSLQLVTRSPILFWTRDSYLTDCCCNHKRLHLVLQTTLVLRSSTRRSRPEPRFSNPTCTITDAGARALGEWRTTDANHDLAEGPSWLNSTNCLGY